MPPASVPPSLPGDDPTRVPGPAPTPAGGDPVGGVPALGHAVAPTAPVGATAGPTAAAVPLATRRRSAWVAMSTLVGVDFAAGLVALLLVPIGRPSGAFPHKGLAVYDLHAALGAGLLVGAVALILAVRRSARMLRIAAWVGLVGIGIAGAGGLLAVDHPWRVAGIGLMFVGSLLAGFAYLVGTMEPQRPPPSQPAAAPTASPAE